MYVFFFVKQKTAYEMRISDWSSDVCSSDLQRSEARQQRGEARQQRSEMRQQQRRQRGNDAQRQQRQTERQRGGTYDRNRDGRIDRRWDRNRNGQVDPIGRASCRERVCQYV